jgi:hypothetical protein
MYQSMGYTHYMHLGSAIILCRVEHCLDCGELMATHTGEVEADGSLEEEHEMAESGLKQIAPIPEELEEGLCDECSLALLM